MLLAARVLLGCEAESRTLIEDRYWPFFRRSRLPREDSQRMTLRAPSTPSSFRLSVAQNDCR